MFSLNQPEGDAEEPGTDGNTFNAQLKRNMRGTSLAWPRALGEDDEPETFDATRFLQST